MTSQAAISALASWLRENVCPSFQMKVANVWEETQQEGYQHEVSHPAVYETYFPRTVAEHTQSDRHSPQFAPCIIVTISGQSTLSTQDGLIEFPVRLLLQTWNPGTPKMSADGQACCEVDAEGWRDIAALADACAKQLACAECPGGLCVTSDITTTLPDVAENDFWPYYRGEVSFTATAARPLPTKFDI